MPVTHRSAPRSFGSAITTVSLLIAIAGVMGWSTSAAHATPPNLHGPDQADDDDPPAAPMTRYVIGDDPQRPGAGVVSVEQARTGGGQARVAPVGRPRRCQTYSDEAMLVWAGTGLARHQANDPTVTVAPTPSSAMNIGQRYFVQCHHADDGTLAYLDSFVYQPGVSGPRVDAIARQVYEEVPLVFPEPHTSPAISAPQLVGFPIWLWVDDGVWRQFDASASVAGVTVTVVAQPREVHWDMGDGTRLTCGRGMVWQPGAPEDGTDCSHVYQYVSDHEPGGRYAASVTVVWGVTWSASTGESGTLPDASRTTTFELDVTERQAVVTYGTGT
jgi:hypothetical protein